MATLEQDLGVEEGTFVEVPVVVETPAKKTSKSRRSRKRRRYYRRSPRVNEVERDWQTWNHDFDTMLHQLVKNKSVNRLAPKTIVKRAEQFADAMLETQNRRRPEGVKSSGRW